MHDCYCKRLDYFYRLLDKMRTESGRLTVIEAIKLHFREGHQGTRCSDPENRYY